MVSDVNAANSTHTATHFLLQHSISGEEQLRLSAENLSDAANESESNECDGRYGRKRP